MDFDDFKVICFAHGIRQDILESCRPFINKHAYMFDRQFNKPAQLFGSRSASSDLGYAELGDIVTQKDSIIEIKNCIKMSTEDYDQLGRDITKLRTKQLIKDPGKHLPRIVLKSYYLHYYNL